MPELMPLREAPTVAELRKVEKSNPEKILFAVDASAILYRSFYAIQGLSTSYGLKTNAIFGFFNSLHKLLKTFNVKNLVIVWDSGESGRKEVLQTYKANRPPMPSDMKRQKEVIVKILSAAGVSQLHVDGYEADDVLGALVRDWKGICVIVSPDKDLQQVINYGGLVFDPVKGDIHDADSFKKAWGFPVSHIWLYFAVLGDSADNIPGVPGIGKKGAEYLAQHYDNLDDVYKHLDELPKRLRSALEKNKELAYLSEELFRLKPLKQKLSPSTGNFKYNPDGWKNASDLFLSLEFKKIPEMFGIKENEALQQAKQFKDYTLIKNEKELEKAISACEKRNSSKIAYDTETNGLGNTDSLAGFSFSVDGKHGYYAAFTDKFDEKSAGSFVKLITGKNFSRIFMHNAKFDLKHSLDFLPYKKIEKRLFDTMVAASLLRKSDNERMGLKELSEEYLHEPMEHYMEVVKSEKKSISEIDPEKVASYSAHDSVQTYKLGEFFEKEFENEENKKIAKWFKQYEMPLVFMLMEMELAGMYVVVDNLKRLEKQAVAALGKLEEKASKILAKEGIHSEVNFGSPKQVSELLYDKLGLEHPSKRLKSGYYSSDRKHLQKLALKNPVAKLILDWRELKKLISSYLKPLPSYIGKDGRIHPSFNQVSVATGRVSVQNPNLQNIPTEPIAGIDIRAAFEAEGERLLISADYSQIDLRSLAHLSGDKKLIESFKHDEDIHRATASWIFGKPQDKITKDERHIGKKVNFGVIYGLTPYGLAQEIGISPKEAKQYIEKYFERHVGVKKWRDSVIEFARTHGYVETLHGRRRYVPNINEKSPALRNAAERVAVNMPVQGTSAEILKIAMLKFKKALGKHYMNGAWPIMQIHDEIIVEADEKISKKIAELLSKTMDSAVKLRVPLKVSLRIGKKWSEI